MGPAALGSAAILDNGKALAYYQGMGCDYTIIFEPCEEGGYTAFVPEVPGAISEGETLEEARDMVLDALRELTEYRKRIAIQEASQRAIVEPLRQAV